LPGEKKKGGKHCGKVGVQMHAAERLVCYQEGLLRGEEIEGGERSEGKIVITGGRKRLESRKTDTEGVSGKRGEKKNPFKAGRPGQKKLESSSISSRSLA